jgi:hypothetical protein
VLWLNSLPPEQRKRVGYVFNGDFEAPLSNTGFDWRIPAQESTIVAAEPGDGVMGKRGLHVAFTSQRYAGPPLYQTLLLEPGKYQLEGKAKAGLDAWLGMQWGVYCLDDAGRPKGQLDSHRPLHRGDALARVPVRIRGSVELSRTAPAPRAGESEAGRADRPMSQFG